MHCKLLGEETTNTLVHHCIPGPDIHLAFNGYRRFSHYPKTHYESLQNYIESKQHQNIKIFTNDLNIYKLSLHTTISHKLTCISPIWVNFFVSWIITTEWLQTYLHIGVAWSLEKILIPGSHSQRLT